MPFYKIKNETVTFTVLAQPFIDKIDKHNAKITGLISLKLHIINAPLPFPMLPSVLRIKKIFLGSFLH